MQWGRYIKASFKKAKSKDCHALSGVTLNLGMTVHISSPRTWETERGGLGIQSQPGLHESISKRNKRHTHKEMAQLAKYSVHKQENLSSIHETSSKTGLWHACNTSTGNKREIHIWIFGWLPRQPNQQASNANKTHSGRFTTDGPWVALLTHTPQTHVTWHYPYFLTHMGF